MARVDARVVSSEAMQGFGDVCRKAGVKMTHQRLEVYREMLGAKDHPCVEDIYRRLKQRLPTISLDTVYRTLDTFERFGLVFKVPVAKGPSRFEANMAPHHHFICAKCQTIHDLSWPGADMVNLPPDIQAMGQIAACHIQLQGVCAKCANGHGSQAV